jgi:alpha-methylacyl-CoA racemase
VPLVLDLTRLLPGPLAGKILLQLGWRVIKVEPPSGELTETAYPEAYRWLNDGKDIRRIDLKAPKGIRALRALAADADIVLDTNRPGVMERLGAGPDEMRRKHPSLVYVRIAGYRDPAFREAPGHDLAYLASDGMLDRLGNAWKDIQVADTAGALWAVAAALEGLRKGGGFFEVYLSEAARVFSYPPMPFLNGGLVCYTLYEAAPGRVALTALEPHLWERFCRVAGKREWESLGTSPAEPSNAVYREMCDFFLERSDTDWEAWGLKHEVPVRSVRTGGPEGEILPWRET